MIFHERTTASIESHKNQLALIHSGHNRRIHIHCVDIRNDIASMRISWFDFIPCPSFGYVTAQERDERTNEWYDIVVVVYALRWFDLCVLWWVTMKCVDARSSVCCVCQRQFVAQSGVMLRAFVDLFDPVCFTHESSDFRWRTFWSLQFDDIHFQMIQYQMEKQCLAS